jgi:hypothetical protein
MRDAWMHGRKHQGHEVCSLASRQAFHATGWTREAVFNVPNALSMGRLISGPFVAYLILQGHWPAAMGTLAVAGELAGWASFPEPQE